MLTLEGPLQALSRAQHITWCSINKYPEGCHGFPRLGNPGLENINKLLPCRTSQSLYCVLFSRSFQEGANTLSLTRRLCFAWGISLVHHPHISPWEILAFWQALMLNSYLPALIWSAVKRANDWGQDKKSKRSPTRCQPREEPKSEYCGKRARGRMMPFV